MSTATRSIFSRLAIVASLVLGAVPCFGTELVLVNAAGVPIRVSLDKINTALQVNARVVIEVSLSGSLSWEAYTLTTGSFFSSDSVGADFFNGTTFSDVSQVTMLFGPDGDYAGVQLFGGPGLVRERDYGALQAMLWLVLCASFSMGFAFMRILRNN